MSIRFRTSGRRAVIADDFTFAGVRKVTEAIYIHSGAAHEVTRSVLVVHDTRFFAGRFPAGCAEVVSSHGFRTSLCSQPTPTPTISHTMRTERSIRGNNFTASHNPPEYAGMKLSTADGGPALPVYETPAGFKYIGELINEDKIILGGEESAGLSIKGQYPEKDGIVACLLAAEAVAARGASLTQQLDALYNRVGKPESGRINLRLTPELRESLSEKLKQEPGEIAGRRVLRTNQLDREVYFCGW